MAGHRARPLFGHLKNFPSIFSEQSLGGAQEEEKVFGCLWGDPGGSFWRGSEVEGLGLG